MHEGSLVAWVGHGEEGLIWSSLGPLRAAAEDRRRGIARKTSEAEGCEGTVGQSARRGMRGR
jgi:hypothetical protein